MPSIDCAWLLLVEQRLLYDALQIRCALPETIQPNVAFAGPQWFVALQENNLWTDFAFLY